MKRKSVFAKSLVAGLLLGFLPLTSWRNFFSGPAPAACLVMRGPLAWAQQAGGSASEAAPQPSPEAQSSPARTGELPPHEQTWEINVAGHTIPVWTRECGELVQQALRKREAVPVEDDRCRAAMEKALEFQRTEPPHLVLKPGRNNWAVDVGGSLGNLIDVPSRNCGLLVEEALLKKQPVAVEDERCREVMQRALAIQRNPPPIRPPATPLPGAGQARKRAKSFSVNTVRVGGQILDAVTPDCANIVQQALMNNAPVPVEEEHCREVMKQALEIQRTTPQAPIGGVPAAHIGAEPRKRN